MAVGAGGTADGQEQAWGISKEQAEVLFNDCRLAAKEDAQRSGDGAASETRNRLHLIVTQVRGIAMMPGRFNMLFAADVDVYPLGVRSFKTC